MAKDHSELDWPAWVGPVVASIAVVLAALTPFIHHQGQRHPLLFALLALAVVPWLASLREPPHPLLFGVGVLAPLAAINWGGEAFGLELRHDAMLSLMLLVWAVGTVASAYRFTVALFFTGFAVLVPLGRALVAGEFDSFALWVAALVMAMLVGLALHLQQSLVVQERAAQRALADEAAVSERQRIAREVHDVIAHSLTVTMLHLTAARMAVRRDPDKAEEALVEAERLGRQALADVRRTVGLLHAGEADATGAALPAAADITELVDAYAAAGVAVTLRSEIDVSGLTPARGLALYRAVQEALANASKHAPGAAVFVDIAHEGDELVLRVTDDGAGASSAAKGRGLGLLGMRERVEALGGRVSAGPTPGGWEVSCAIPTRVDA